VGLVHSHAGGTEPHCHDEAANLASGEHAHPHPHPHPHHKRDREQAQPRDEALHDAGQVHVHLWLFGFHLSLPAPADLPEDLPQIETLFVALPHAGTVTHEREGANSLVTLQEQLSVPTGLAHLRQAGSIAFKQRTSFPLCDTARLERSGVQLI
jgi:hypothetical protein